MEMQLQHERPRIISGVEASRQTTRDGRPYVIVRNPAASMYLRLAPCDHVLMSLMDGTRSVDELVMAHAQSHGALAPLHVWGLVEHLQQNQFIASPLPDGQVRAPEPKAPSRGLIARLARGFLRAELRIHGIDAKLARLYRAIGWIFFSRAGAAIGICLAALGPILLASAFATGRVPRLSVGGSYLVGLPMLTAALFATLVLHELGHAMAVKHAGRHVPHAGLMLYFGLPTAYVATADIWMASRRNRLVASFAGPYMDLIASGICALVAAFLPHAALREGAFTLGCLLLLRVLSALNPLLEMDGYYLLVDWLEKPVLRAHALRFARVGLWAKWRQKQALTREEIFFALFGIASATCSGVMLALSIRFWQVRVIRLLSEGLASADPSVLAGMLVMIGLISMPMLPRLSHLARGARGAAIRGVNALTAERPGRIATPGQ